MSEQIKAQSVVTLHFSIKLTDGSAADSTKVHNKPAQFTVGDGSMSENFENCLLGMSAGQSDSFTLAPDDAFGMPNPDNIHYVDRNKFSGETPAEVGMILSFAGPDGMEMPGIVREVIGDSVTVDFNHPLAGQTVIFDVEIIEVNNS